MAHAAAPGDSPLSRMTRAEWQQYAGQVLAIDPGTDQIMATADTEAELRARPFASAVVEFFHVPAAGELRRPVE